VLNSSFKPTAGLEWANPSKSPSESQRTHFHQLRAEGGIAWETKWNGESQLRHQSCPPRPDILCGVKDSLPEMLGSSFGLFAGA
jgi:hypothetical protein